MFPNMIPFSVEATLTLALMFVKSWGPRITGWGFSTNFKSPESKKVMLCDLINQPLKSTLELNLLWIKF